MVWNILRPRFWLLKRQLLGNNSRERAINLSFIAGLLALALYGLFRLGTRLAGENGAGFLLALIPAMATVLLLFMLIQLGDTLYQLFLAPDLPWVMRAPLPYPALFTAKLIECSFALWLPAAAMLGVLLTLGIAQAAPWPYYPLAAVILLALLVAVSGLGMLLMLLLARLVPPKRLRELLPVVIGLASVAAVFGQQILLRSLMGWQAPVQLLLAALSDPAGMGLLAAALAGTAVLVAGVAYSLYRAFHSELYSGLQTSGATVRAAKPAGLPARAATASRWAGLFPGVEPYLAEKEWKTLVRDPRRAINFVLTPVVMIALLYPMAAADSPFRPLLFWVILFYASFFGISSAEGAALPSFTGEGLAFARLAASPVSMRAIMRSKFWLSYAPVAVPWILAGLGAGVVLHMPAWQIGALLACLLTGLAGNCAICVAFSAQEADFTLPSPKPRFAPGVSWIVIALCVFWQCLALAVVTGAVLYFARGNAMLAGLMGATRGIPGLAWVMASGGLPMLVLGLAGLLLLGLVLQRSWAAAVARLESWEIG